MIRAHSGARRPTDSMLLPRLVQGRVATADSRPCTSSDATPDATRRRLITIPLPPGCSPFARRSRTRRLGIGNTPATNGAATRTNSLARVVSGRTRITPSTPPSRCLSWIRPISACQSRGAVSASTPKRQPGPAITASHRRESRAFGSGTSMAQRRSPPMRSRNAASSATCALSRSGAQPGTGGSTGPARALQRRGQRGRRRGRRSGPAPGGSAWPAMLHGRQRQRGAKRRRSGAFPESPAPTAIRNRRPSSAPRSARRSLVAIGSHLRDGRLSATYSLPGEGRGACCCREHNG